MKYLPGMHFYTVWGVVIEEVEILEVEDINKIIQGYQLVRCVSSPESHLNRYINESELYATEKEALNGYRLHIDKQIAAEYEELERAKERIKHIERRITQWRKTDAQLLDWYNKHR